MKALRITGISLLIIVATAIVLLLCWSPLEESRHQHMVEATYPDSTFVHLCTNAQEFYDSLAVHIGSAQKSIYMDMYEFKNDSIGGEIMRCLLAAASRGVEVMLELDGFGTPADEWNREELASKGVTIKSIDPIEVPYLNHLLCRDHRKVVIIDGKWNSIGCTNIADYYIKGLPEVGNWNDMTLTFSAGNRSVTILETKEEYTRALERLLGTASSSIHIIQPYIALPSSMEEKILDAIGRGVDVEFLIGEKGDIPSYLASAMGFLHKMQEAGAKVWIYKPGFHHTKAVCADDQHLFIGSVNFTCRSFRRNAEEAALTNDKPAAEEFNRQFNNFKAESVPLDEAYWKELSPLTRAKYNIYHRFRYLIPD